MVRMNAAADQHVTLSSGATQCGRKFFESANAASRGYNYGILALTREVAISSSDAGIFLPSPRQCLD